MVFVQLVSSDVDGTCVSDTGPACTTGTLVGTQCEVERENGLCPAGSSDVDGTCVSDTGPACTTGTLVGTQCEVERENGLCPAG